MDFMTKKPLFAMIRSYLFFGLCCLFAASAAAEIIDLGKAPEHHSKIYFSESQTAIAWVGRKGSRMCVYVNGKSGPKFDEIVKHSSQDTMLLDGEKFYYDSPVRLSKRGNHFAYVGRRADSFFVVVDDNSYGPFSRVPVKPVFSDNGETSVFCAIHEGVKDEDSKIEYFLNGKSIIQRGGKYAINQFNKSVWLSPLGKHTVILAKDGDDLSSSMSLTVVSNGSKVEYKGIPAFLPTGFGMPRFSSLCTEDEEDFYLVVTQKTEGINDRSRRDSVYTEFYKNGKKIGKHRQMGCIRLQDNSFRKKEPLREVTPSRAFYLTKDGKVGYTKDPSVGAKGGVDCTLVLDGKEYPVKNAKNANDVTSPIYVSKDLTQYAYVQETGSGWKGGAMCVNGKTEYEYKKTLGFTFLDIGGNYSYFASHEGLTYPVINGEEQDGVKRILRFVFSPDGKNYAYIVGSNDKPTLYVNGKILKKPNVRVDSLTYSANGRLSYTYRPSRDKIVVVIGEKEYSSFPKNSRISRVIFSENGETDAFLASYYDGKNHRHQTVVNGKLWNNRGAGHSYGSGPYISSNGKNVFFFTYLGHRDKSCYIYNGKILPGKAIGPRIKGGYGPRDPDAHSPHHAVLDDGRFLYYTRKGENIFMNIVSPGAPTISQSDNKKDDRKVVEAPSGQSKKAPKKKTPTDKSVPKKKSDPVEDLIKKEAKKQIEKGLRRLFK